MSTTRDGRSLLLDKTPISIRMRIFQEVLRFDHPLVKVKRASKRHGANTSLLRVNKQIKAEALPILYRVHTNAHPTQGVARLVQPLTSGVPLQVNTISLTHASLCDVGRPQSPPRPGLIKRLVLRLDRDTRDTWMLCPRCMHVDGLLNLVLGGRFPNLRAVTVHLDQHWIGCKASRLALEQRGSKLAFTAVGQFGITDLRRDGLSVRFEYPALGSAWKWLAALDWTDLTLRPVFFQRRGGGLPDRVVREIFNLFRAAHIGQRKPSRKFSVRVKSGVRSDWLQEENRNAETFERITDMLVQYQKRG